MLRRLAPALVLAGSLCASPGAAWSGAASPAGTPGGEPTLEELFREAEDAYAYGANWSHVPIYRRAVALYPESAEAHMRLGYELESMAIDQAIESASERGEDWPQEPFDPSSPSGYCRNLYPEGGASCGPLCVEASAAFCTAFVLDPSLFCDPSCERFCDQLCTRSRVWYFPEEVIRSALARHPRSACAHHHLARLLSDEERVEEAAAAYRRVLELAPGRDCVPRDLAHLLFDQGRYEEAADAINRLPEPGPQDLDLLSRIADGQIHDGRPEPAEATLIKLADHYRRAIERNRSELARHLAAGDEEEALWAVPPDVDLRAALAWAQTKIGVLRWQQGRHEAAQGEFRESVALLGEPSPARVAFEAHFALTDPVRYWINDRWRARLRDQGQILLWIQAEMGDEAAAGFLRQALDVVSGTDYRERWGNWAEADIARELGRCLLRLGRNEEAAEAFRLGLDLEPEAAHLRNDLGLALFRLERFSEAETEWRRAIDLDPNHPRAYRSLGWLMAERGRLDEGVALYRQAIELAPDDARMRYYLGWLLLRAGHVREALAQYALAGESQLRDAGGRALDELFGSVGQADPSVRP